jgi:hypothetical protein
MQAICESSSAGRKTAASSRLSPARDPRRQAAVLRFQWRIAERSASIAGIDIAIGIPANAPNIRRRDEVRWSAIDLSPHFDFQAKEKSNALISR